MAGRYRGARKGQKVVVRSVHVPFTLWPDEYITRGRLITSDPWACLRSYVRQEMKPGPKQNRAIAFLMQAEDFFEAASAPRIASKPLLYYYSFMNLTKAFLTVHTNLDLKRCVHGLKEPPDNTHKRLTITSQFVKANDGGGTRIQLYREFMKECGFPLPKKVAPVKVMDLLEQIVGIHRITSHTLKRTRQYFLINDISFECDPASKQAWITLYVGRQEIEDAATQVRQNTTSFDEVESPQDKRSCRRYESKPIHYTSSPSQVLRELVLCTWQDIWSELRPGGYRFWFSSIPKAKRRAQLASGYMAMFYFGSVSRYRPDAFQKLIDGKHGWMVQEFINTQPLQFIYFLGSGLVDTEMVPPELA